MLDEDAYAQIEANADIILEEVGVAFQEFPSALALWKDAGADVRDEMVHFPKGLCRRIIQATAPSAYTQHARNPQRSVQIGGDAVDLAPGRGTTTRGSSSRSRPRRR